MNSTGPTHPQIFLTAHQSQLAIQQPQATTLQALHALSRFILTKKTTHLHTAILLLLPGDPKRDKIRKLLCDGLALVPDAHRQGLDPGEVAAEVELAIYNKYGGNTGAEYSSKVRTLSFNLKDANNPNLRTRVLTGVIDPQVLLVNGIA